MIDKKSSVVMVLGWLNIVLGFFFSFLTLVESFVVSNKMGIQKIVGSPQMVLWLISFLIWIGFIITGFGVLKLQEKARANTVYLAGILCVFNIFFNPNAFSSFNYLIAIVYSLLVIIFLISPKIRKHFN